MIASPEPKMRISKRDARRPELHVSHTSGRLSVTLFLSAGDLAQATDEDRGGG